MVSEVLTSDGTGTEAARTETGKQLGQGLKEKFHNEIEFYTLETRTRVALAEMLKPIFVETDRDRNKVAELLCYVEQADERLKKLEYTLGLTKKAKPKAFLEIEDNFAEFKKTSQQKFNDVNA